MKQPIDYIEGLWRSRTLRWAVLVAAAYLAGQHYGFSAKAHQAITSVVDPAVLTSGGYKLVLALCGILLQQEVLKAFDNYGGVRPRDNWAIMRQEPRALATYLGLRMLATAVLVGLVLM